jgi:sugar phosphate isomerase/epimerase
MQTRREFLETLGLAAVGAATLGCVPSSAFAGAAGSAHLPIGIQLYTLRTLMARDFDGTLAQVAGIGYREVEFAGYFGRTPAQVRAALRQYGLAAPSTHVALPADDAAWARTLDEAKAIGHQWVTIAWLDAPLRRTPDDWARLAERFNGLGAQARAAGLRFAYHNHDFEFARVGDSSLFDVLLKKTDPAVVDLEMDVYWVTKAGADPLALIRQHPGRFPLLHLKDATAAPARRMVEVGAGTIDFKAILAADHGTLKHAFVEHDNPTDPLASARASYAYLSRLSY